MTGWAVQVQAAHGLPITTFLTAAATMKRGDTETNQHLGEAEAEQDTEQLLARNRGGDDEGDDDDDGREAACTPAAQLRLGGTVIYVYIYICVCVCIIREREKKVEDNAECGERGSNQWNCEFLACSNSVCLYLV